MLIHVRATLPVALTARHARAVSWHLPCDPYAPIGSPRPCALFINPAARRRASVHAIRSSERPRVMRRSQRCSWRYRNFVHVEQALIASEEKYGSNPHRAAMPIAGVRPFQPRSRSEDARDSMAREHDTTVAPPVSASAPVTLLLPMHPLDYSCLEQAARLLGSDIDSLVRLAIHKEVTAILSQE